MRQRAPIVLSITALVVAVLAATPLGQATAKKVAAKFPPFARTAGFARLSGNSNKLNNHKSTLRGLPGTIPVVGVNGKLPASIGAVGPQGPAGPAGAAGAKGDRGPAGPTKGVASSTGAPNSYTNMADIGQPTSINVETPSTLFVFGRVQATLVCTANQSCSRHFGIYVDGDQVEGTLVEVHAYSTLGTTDSFAVFGTKTVGAGMHTLRFRAGNSANVTGALDVLPNLGAIQLGGS
jgi:hypothetical protein